IVGPGPVHLTVVVAVRSVAADIEDRPVGDVPEQEVGVLGDVCRLVQRLDLDEPFLVPFSGNVPQLTWIAATERGLSPAVQHLAADVEILIDHEHPQIGVACPDGAGHAGRSRADDQNVRLVVPLDLARGLRRRLGDTKSGGASSGDCAAREEVSPTEGLIVGVLLLPLIAALLGHVSSSLCRASYSAASLSNSLAAGQEIEKRGFAPAGL